MAERAKDGDAKDRGRLKRYVATQVGHAPLCNWGVADSSHAPLDLIEVSLSKIQNPNLLPVSRSLFSKSIVANKVNNNAFWKWPGWPPAWQPPPLEYECL